MGSQTIRNHNQVKEFYERHTRHLMNTFTIHQIFDLTIEQVAFLEDHEIRMLENIAYYKCYQCEESMFLDYSDKFQDTLVDILNSIGIEIER